MTMEWERDGDAFCTQAAPVNDDAVLFDGGC